MIMNLPSGWFNQDDVDFYRELVAKVPFNEKIAELGVWMGKSLCSVADIIRGRNLSVVAVDTFKGTLSEEVLMQQAKETDLKEEFLKNIADFGIADRTLVLDMTTLEAAKQIEDGSLFLVFVDAEHTEKACGEDIDTWLPKIKEGGIIAGHDYSFWGGVKSAVDKRFGDRVQSNKNIWYVNL